MKYSIGEIRNKLFKHVYDVHKIVEEYFGEEFTDLQNIPDDSELGARLGIVECTLEDDKWNISKSQMDALKRLYHDYRAFILVYWPEVTVTNEHNRSVDIQDLYAKIEVTIEGRIPYENRGFQLVRTTYPQKQFADGYCHSHIPHFNGIPHFDNPCLGSGPINHTIMDLKNGYEEMTWMLFCRELSLYVTVESLEGVPYNKLENIGKSNSTQLYLFSGYDDRHYAHIETFTREGEDINEFTQQLTDFTKYYLENGHLKLDFDGTKYVPGMPYFDFMIDISNSFIEWYNKYGDLSQTQQLYRKEILVPTYTKGGKFFSNSSNSMSTAAYEGTRILDFKGESKCLHIVTDNTETECTLVLAQHLAMYILGGILSIINYRFNDEHNNHRNRGESSSSNQEGTAETYENVLYI